MSEINQMIARGVDPIQVQSPVNQLAQIEQIRSAQQTNMLRQEQMTALQREREQLQTLNRLYGEAYNPTTGRVDETKLYSGLAQGGLGSQIPRLQKEEFERRKTEFATSKEESEAILKRLEFKRTQLVGVTPLTHTLIGRCLGSMTPYLAVHYAQTGHRLKRLWSE
jgi:hypothetical protein